MIKKVCRSYFFILLFFAFNSVCIYASENIIISIESHPPYSYMKDEKANGVLVSILNKTLKRIGIKEYEYKFYDNSGEMIKIIDEASKRDIIVLSNDDREFERFDYFVIPLIFNCFVGDDFNYDYSTPPDYLNTIPSYEGYFHYSSVKIVFKKNAKEISEKINNEIDIMKLDGSYFNIINDELYLKHNCN